MNILILGGGGREHALALQISKSPKCYKLFIAPGNAGTKDVATNLAVSPTDFEAIKKVVLEHKIRMVIVGPEDPLVLGIKDFFEEDKALKKVLVLGPPQIGAEMEGSKNRAKGFMYKYGIPTAAYETLEKRQVEGGKKFLRLFKPPFVLKADGLAAGKGVLIIDKLEDAQQALEDMLVHRKFGDASNRVVVEEYLEGIELSVFVLTDGKTHITLPTAKDYKRVGEGDTGLNTGGMGAVSPPPFVDDAFMAHVEKDIIAPTIEGLRRDEIDYRGFIFIGLMKMGDKAKVIEYNVRLGDPETEVVLPRIENDLVDLFEKTCLGKLHEVELKVSNKTAATVIAVSGGYPEDYEKGKEITGIDNVKDSIVFHAGTKEENGKILTNGGRVLAVTSFGENHEEATKKSYESLEKISFDKMNYRKDIGKDL